MITIKTLSQLILAAVALIVAFRSKVSDLMKQLADRDSTIAELKKQLAEDETQRQAAEEAAAQSASQRDALQGEIDTLHTEAQTLADAVEAHPDVDPIQGGAQGTEEQPPAAQGTGGTAESGPGGPGAATEEQAQGGA